MMRRWGSRGHLAPQTIETFPRLDILGTPMRPLGSCFLEPLLGLLYGGIEEGNDGERGQPLADVDFDCMIAEMSGGAKRTTAARPRNASARPPILDV